jgi:mitochondrial fission protein ELM1
MSEIKFCPRGGMDGVFVTEEQLKIFAKKLGTKYLDEVIPLPISFGQVSPKDCPYLINNHADNDIIYWETEDGSHGWCCQKCGQVIQWG